MELRTIEKLLEKYFDAETTLAEEQLLKEYFASEGVAPQFAHYRPMFGYYTAQGAEETFTRPLPLRRKVAYHKWFSVAASVVLLAGIVTVYHLNGNDATQQELGTYDNPEEAFRETQKALNMLSVNVNKGVKSVHYIGEYEKARRSVFKQ